MNGWKKSLMVGLGGAYLAGMASLASSRPIRWNVFDVVLAFAIVTIMARVRLAHRPGAHRVAWGLLLVYWIACLMDVSARSQGDPYLASQLLLGPFYSFSTYAGSLWYLGDDERGGAGERGRRFVTQVWLGVVVLSATAALSPVLHPDGNPRVQFAMVALFCVFIPLFPLAVGVAELVTVSRRSPLYGNREVL